MKLGTLLVCFMLALGAFSQPADSLRITPQSVPVTFQEDTLFFFHSSIGPFSPADRLSTFNSRISNLLEHPDFNPDSLLVVEETLTSNILFDSIVLVSVTNQDAEVEGLTRQVLAERNRQVLQRVLDEAMQSASIRVILTRTGLTLLELLIIYLVVFYINKFFRFTRKWLLTSREKIIKGIKFKGYEFLDQEHELKIALYLNNTLKWVVIAIVLYLALPILFSIFPWTQGWAELLFGYILSPLRSITTAIFNYIPNLITIAVIYTVTRYSVKFIGFLAGEIERGSLVIKNFFPDWARPTFNLVKVLMYAFMFIVIFPYLPGSDSPVFQGVSIFLGVLFSLGSSSAISNAVAGFVITYMRPFKIGDRIKIGEITGDVMEKSMLVTRVRTIKNEDITIPNASVLSGHTVNYTTAAKDIGLIVHSTITIGYDVPWKKVHQLLIDAALATTGILKDNRKPFVLQTSLDDFYVSYQINAHTIDSHRMAMIYSDLHQHIQDKFNEAGVEIMSPHYRGVRDGNGSAMPPDALPKDYVPSAFNVKVVDRSKG